MSRTIIENAAVFTGETFLSAARVVMEGEVIARVGPAGEGTPEADRSDSDVLVDAGGRLVTPGLVNAHTHAYSALARGIVLKDPPPADFRGILERLWWRLDRALGPEEIRYSALLHGIECLKSGVTTVFDHHSSQRGIRGSLRTISDALDQLGIRAGLCFEVSDREGPDAAREGIEENLTFAREILSDRSSMRAVHFGLHASFTLSDHTLKLCRDSLAATLGSGRMGYHVHLAEDRIDQELTRERHGESVVERLARWEVLGPRTICVHGVHLTEEELRILAISGAWLVHCPESNMNNGVGAIRLSSALSAGVRLAIGTDGFAANMMRECLVAHLLQNHIAADPRAGYGVVPELLFGGNSELASSAFGVRLGRIAEGGPADVVVWDYRPPTPLSATNLHGHVMFGLVDAGASDVWVAGRRALGEGKVIGVDETAVIRGCEKAAGILWERF